MAHLLRRTAAEVEMLLIPLSVEVERVREEIRVELASDTCAAVMGAVADDLAALRPEEVDPADLRAHGAATIRALFAARVEAQEALGRLHAAGGLDRECLLAVRRADHAARALADDLYLALPADERPDAWLSVDGDGRPALRTGDVLVTRAVALSSAGIAHLGEVDSPFSHNALVYVDELGRSWTISAYMEKGAVIEPLEVFLASDLGRVVVLRHEDPALAARAAAAAHERVARGPHVPYDDGFDADDGSALFCSEVPRWAFGALIGEPATVPLDFTRFPAGARPLLDAMDIDVDRTSMPADVLFDPRFAIVGEWRSVADLATMRRHDAVAESAYRWIEQEGYALDPSAAERATVAVGLALRRTPGLAALVEDKILPTSDRAFLVTGLAFDHAGRRLDAALVARAGEGSRSRAEWLAELEALRAEDLATWRSHPAAALFHRTLHPPR